MKYEATVVGGIRIYRVFCNEKLLVEVDQKKLPRVPGLFEKAGYPEVAEDMIESLPNLHKCTCKVCGTEFVGAASRNYTCSSECKKKYILMQRGRYVKKSDNEENVKRARELGMSYGKYMAMKYIEAGNASVKI